MGAVQKPVPSPCTSVGGSAAAAGGGGDGADDSHVMQSLEPLAPMKGSIGNPMPQLAHPASHLQSAILTLPDPKHSLGPVFAAQNPEPSVWTTVGVDPSGHVMQSLEPLTPWKGASSLP